MAVKMLKAKLFLAAALSLVACVLGCSKAAQIRLWNHTGVSITASVAGQTCTLAPNAAAKFNMPHPGEKILVSLNGTNLQFIYVDVEGIFWEKGSIGYVVNYRLEADLRLYQAAAYATNLNAPLPAQPGGYPLKPTS
jgi:hypothetical protein